MKEINHLVVLRTAMTDNVEIRPIQVYRINISPLFIVRCWAIEQHVLCISGSSLPGKDLCHLLMMNYNYALILIVSRNGKNI